ncbi:hypothetical protein QE152_g26051 [Popillia japonica]|uniref:Uncharacterized protein n=1 Tax=Popillia japonica TaxID=7064 RepID=A0AAW1JZL1_POPJA
MPNTRPTRRSIRNTQHDEVRRNTRRSLSEPRQPTEPKTETIANVTHLMIYQLTSRQHREVREPILQFEEKTTKLVETHE